MGKCQIKLGKAIVLETVVTAQNLCLLLYYIGSNLMWLFSVLFKIQGRGSRYQEDSQLPRNSRLILAKFILITYVNTNFSKSEGTKGVYLKRQE